LASTPIPTGLRARRAGESVETPSSWAIDLGTSIESALEARGKHFWSTSQKGEKWLNALCPFHDDHTPSGRWQPGTLTFFCHACSASFTLLELAHALNIDPNPQKPLLTVVARRLKSRCRYHWHRASGHHRQPRTGV